jgi:dihydrofolate reductase
MPKIVGIAAVARNGVIGADGDIPWRIPEDWRRFQRLTMGQALIMGRKTWASIGRPLPGRTTYVVTRDRTLTSGTTPLHARGDRGNAREVPPTWAGEDVYAVPSLDEAFAQAAAREPRTIFVAGGGEIYRAAWDRLAELEITQVDAEPAGDVTFPTIDPDVWVETARDARDGYAFVSYRRR